MKKNNKTNKKIKKKKNTAKNFNKKQINKSKIKTAVQFKEISQFDVSQIYMSLSQKEKGIVKNFISKTDGSFFRLGIQVNNKIVAYAELKKLEDSHGQLVFAVLEDYRGNGFAKILATRVVQMAPLIGVKKITYVPVSDKTRNMVNEISKQFKKVDKNKYEINFTCC
jgi:GNAT superfamily N-acetyltransferase